MSGGAVDTEFGAAVGDRTLGIDGPDVVDAGEIKRLARREAEGYVEEAAVVERGHADQPAVGRAGDARGGALYGEALPGHPALRTTAVLHRVGRDRHLDIAGAVDPETVRIEVETEEVVAQRCDRCAEHRQRWAIDALPAHAHAGGQWRVGERVDRARVVLERRRREGDVEIAAAGIRERDRIRHLRVGDGGRLAGERPGAWRGSEIERHALAAVSGEIAADTVAIDVAVADFLRRDVVHQRDVAGAGLGRILAAVGERELGRQVGDRGRVNIEAGRQVVEIDREPLRAGQRGGGSRRRRGDRRQERPATGDEVDVDRVVGSRVGHPAPGAGGPVAEGVAAVVVGGVDTHRRLAAVLLDRAQAGTAQDELGGEVGHRGDVELVGRVRRRGDPG